MLRKSRSTFFRKIPYMSEQQAGVMAPWRRVPSRDVQISLRSGSPGQTSGTGGHGPKLRPSDWPPAWLSGLPESSRETALMERRTKENFGRERTRAMLLCGSKREYDTPGETEVSPLPQRGAFGWGRGAHGLSQNREEESIAAGMLVPRPGKASADGLHGNRSPEGHQEADEGVSSPRTSLCWRNGFGGAGPPGSPISSASRWCWLL